MKSKQTMFFSVFTDIEPIIKSIESTHQIHYFETGLFDNKEVNNYNSLFEISNLGFTKYGDWNYDKSFLLLPKQLSLKVREVPQRKGGVKYAVDQLINPASIILQIGGIYSEKDNVLVAGKVGTVSEDVFSLEMYKAFHSKIKKEFSKIQEFYVGKGAQERLKLGWRLVLDEGRKKEYDLIIK
jgi:hypothetical protein